MSQERAVFKVTGDVEAEVIQKSVELFRNEFDERVELTVEMDRAIKADDVFTVETALAIATLISLLFKLVVYVYERAKSASWDKPKFLKAIETEMEKQSIHDFIIRDIVNFGCLIGKGDCPCEVTVLSRSSTRGYKVLMFRDGKVFTFQVAHHIGI